MIHILALLAQVTINGVALPPSTRVTITYPTRTATPTMAIATPTVTATAVSDPIRPTNLTPNLSQPSAMDLAGFRAGRPIPEISAATMPNYVSRINANCAQPTTAGILECEAAKWGFDPVLVKAIAVNESNWNQWRLDNAHPTDPAIATTSIMRNLTGSLSIFVSHGDPQSYTADGKGGSWGIMQVKENDWPQSWPMSAKSTAFNVDFKLALQRACMDKQIGYLAERTPTAGYPTYAAATGQQLTDLCTGQWYSGGWADAGALTYIAQVKSIMVAQPWLRSGF